MILIEVTDIKALIMELTKLPNHYMYRGHSCIEWNLSSTLERLLGDKFCDCAEKHEKYSINEFNKKYHLYCKANNIPKTKLERLAIMQHYGIPTKLLDFTLSPFVALYFSIENSEKTNDCLSIYALDYRRINKYSINYLKNNLTNNQSINYSDVAFNEDKIFEQIDENSLEILWTVEPNISNLRLDKQSGCFLTSGCTKMSIEKLLSKDIYKEIENYKFIIKGIHWDNIYTLLQKMNITAKTIYGDMEGLSKSIKMQMKAYS